MDFTPTCLARPLTDEELQAVIAYEQVQKDS